MIESLFILFFETVEEEVEGEVSIALDQHGGYGIFFDGLHLFVDSDVGDLLAHLSFIPILC